MAKRKLKAQKKSLYHDGFEGTLEVIRNYLDEVEADIVAIGGQDITITWDQDYWDDSEQRPRAHYKILETEAEAELREARSKKDRESKRKINAKVRAKKLEQDKKEFARLSKLNEQGKL